MTIAALPWMVSMVGTAAAQSTCAPGTPQVIIYHAGSLTAAFSQAGVLIAGSNPFLDPSGYRADLIFQLAERRYRIPNLYDTLLGHYTLTRTGDALGKNFDYQFTYQHSAYAAYLANPSGYRYATLPDDIGLSDSELNRDYEESSIVIPGLRTPHSQPVVRLPASRVVWGLTILKSAPNEANAIKFLQLLFGNAGVAILQSTGPEPITPPRVSRDDYPVLPAALRAIVQPVHRSQ